MILANQNATAVTQLPDDFPIGLHHWQLMVSNNAIGQPWLVPVTTYETGLPGPRLVLTAGVHGDEFHGIVTAQRIIRELLSQCQCGSVMVWPMVNLSAVLANQRYFAPADNDSAPADLNRLFPGDPNGSVAARYCAEVWQHLSAFKPDYAVDLHSQGRGGIYPLMAFVDGRNPNAKLIAEALLVDVIQQDPGEPGVLETQWMSMGVPATTLEIGGGSVLDLPLLQRTYDGVENLFKTLGLMAGTRIVREPLWGEQTQTVRAKSGGMILPQVALGEHVESGQLLAIQYDPFGQETQRYVAPIDGYVLTMMDTPMREPNAMIVRLLNLY